MSAYRKKPKKPKTNSSRGTPTPAHLMAKARLEERGISVAQFARDHGFAEKTVYDVLQNRVAGKYGEAHAAAVALGIKPAPEPVSTSTSALAPASVGATFESPASRSLDVPPAQPGSANLTPADSAGAFSRTKRTPKPLPAILPETGFVRVSQLIPGILPFSATTLYRLVKREDFPPPIKIGAISVWNASVVRDWITSLEPAKK